MKIITTLSDYDFYINISPEQLTAPSITQADRLEITCMKINTLYVPEGIIFLSIIDCDIDHLILSSSIQIFDGIVKSEQRCSIKNITLNENIYEVVCPNCNVVTIDSPYDFLPNLCALDIRYNKIKCIDFRTEYSIPVMVEGNDGIKFKYIDFAVNELHGISKQKSDYIKVSTTIIPTYFQGYLLFNAVASGETFIDIHTFLLETKDFK